MSEVERNILKFILDNEGNAVDVDNVFIPIGTDRRTAVRAMFRLRRRGYLKREGWRMAPAVPLGLLQQAAQGGDNAAERC